MLQTTLVFSKEVGYFASESNFCEKVLTHVVSITPSILFGHMTGVGRCAKKTPENFLFFSVLSLGIKMTILLTLRI